MERRREPRFALAEPLVVTLLEASRQRIEASVTDVSRNGLCLRLPCKIPAGTPVQIETQHTLVLGDICYCLPEESAFRAGVAVKHRLALEELPALAAWARP